MPITSPAEYNTIITMLGMFAATVQGGTGVYAAFRKKKISYLKTNDVLFRAHRAFGGAATTLYLLGLFAGITGLIGGLTQGDPPLELNDLSYNIHTWPSILAAFVILWKTYISYFDKKRVYKQARWLGIATWIAWSYTWITAAISYYIRTQPPNLQHEPPNFLLPYDLAWLQIFLPYILAMLVLIAIFYYAQKFEKKKNKIALYPQKKN